MHYIHVYEAIMENDDVSFKRFLDNGFNPNIEYGVRYPLEVAVAFRNEQAIKMLMMYGATPIPQICKKSSLHEAVLRDDYMMVKELLDKKTYVNNVLFCCGFTPLCFAVFLNMTDMVKLLLKHSADVEIPNVELSTPLHLAVTRQNTKVIKLLLKKGAKIDLEDITGHTPLSLAVESGNTEICNILLKNRKSGNNGSKSLLLLAALNGNKDIIRSLLDHGEDVNSVFNFDGKSCTVLEVIRERYPERLDTDAIAELVSAVVISKCKHMSEEQEKGFSKNSPVVLEVESLLQVALKCGEEFMEMEETRVGKKNLYEICILKQNKHLNVKTLLKYYSRITKIYSKLHFYKHTMTRVIQIMENRRAKLQKAMTITNNVLENNTNWNMVPLEIKYEIFEKIRNRDLNMLVH
ncbi:ankyrin repeat protein [Fowlpox virus]|nr:ankyrin repeat protein [Fowlpox virus]